MKNSLTHCRDLGFASLPRGQDMLYVFVPSNIHDSMMLQLAILGPTKGDVLQTSFGTDAHADKFKLPCPNFVFDPIERFLNLSFINTDAKDLYKPSTGALILLTALHTCDQVTTYGVITRIY